MRKAIIILRPAIVCFGAMTIICGILYTAAVTGVAQLVFPHQANGSIITVTLSDEAYKDYGSILIAQNFSAPNYMIGRPSGTSNLSPVSKEQEKLVQKRVDWWHSFDPDNLADIPMDLVTASGSGVDPHISLAAAEYQVSRIAQERDIAEAEVRAIISKYTKGRLLGFIGEESVNVLQVNLALDGLT